MADNEVCRGMRFGDNGIMAFEGCLQWDSRPTVDCLQTNWDFGSGPYLVKVDVFKKSRQTHDLFIFH